MQIFTYLSRHLLSIKEFAALVWTLSAFALLTTFLRLYIRTFASKAFGLDDGLMILGQLSAVVVTAFAHWNAASFWKVYHYNESTDIFSFSSFNILSEADILVRSAVLMEIVYLVTLALIKCSILAFYRRIVAQKKHRLLIYIVAVVIILQSFINLLMIIFSSDPQFTWWNLATTFADERANEDESSRDRLNLANSAFQVLFDVIILALPIPVIIKTKFKRRDRVGLLIIYALSFLSLAATIVRLYMVFKYDQAENLLDGGVARLDYSCWTVVEIVTAIICANLPATSSLIRHCNRNRIKATRAYKVTSRFSNKLIVLQGRMYSIITTSTIRNERKNKSSNSDNNIDSLSQSDMLEKGSHDTLTNGYWKKVFDLTRKTHVDDSMTNSNTTTTTNNTNTSSSMNTSYYSSENSDVFSSNKSKKSNKSNKYSKKNQAPRPRPSKSAKHIPIFVSSSNAGSSTVTTTTTSGGTGGAAAVPAKNETSWLEPKTEICNDDDDVDDDDENPVNGNRLRR